MHRSSFIIYKVERISRIGETTFLVQKEFLVKCSRIWIIWTFWEKRKIPYWRLSKWSKDDVRKKYLQALKFKVKKGCWTFYINVIIQLRKTVETDPLFSWWNWSTRSVPDVPVYIELPYSNQTALFIRKISTSSIWTETDPLGFNWSTLVSDNAKPDQFLFEPDQIGNVDSLK